MLAVGMLSSTEAQPQSDVVPVLGCWRRASLSDSTASGIGRENLEVTDRAHTHTHRVICL